MIVTGEFPQNDRALRESEVCFHLSSTLLLDQRVVTKYYLLGQDDSTNERATVVLKEFLKENPHLFPTFSMGDLKNEIHNNPFLIINGRAVCLAKDREEERSAEFRDEYYTRGLLDQPVRCSKGHLLNKKCAVLWKEKAGDSCPAGLDHKIGSDDVDEALEKQIKMCKEERTERKARVEEALLENDLLKKEVERLKKESALVCLNGELANGRMVNQQSLTSQLQGRVIPITGLGALGKLVYKCADKASMIKFLQEMLKKKGSEFGLSVAKKIPLVSLFLGAVLAVYRAYHKDYYRATLEILSGGVACMPGWGTALSVGIDVSLIGVDIVCKNPDETQETKLALDNAYRALGLDPASTPGQQEVERAVRDQLQILRVDAIQHVCGNWSQKISNTLCSLITSAREVIFRHNGWELNVLPLETVS